eukprot:TRINITY_DN30714_c0_g1_i1.p1 TRINITY_DN30714_c0_g1~~TRINITY_DN30714_c0_g1_i1.p1  ORF type:complete len:405 (+),score=105.16 TRINITY_DN30714_c0_g1_i1:86-1216(+)
MQRSSSPADRGLHTSQWELSRRIALHSIPLRSSPAPRPAPRQAAPSGRVLATYAAQPPQRRPLSPRPHSPGANAVPPHVAPLPSGGRASVSPPRSPQQRDLQLLPNAEPPGSPLRLREPSPAPAPEQPSPGQPHPRGAVYPWEYPPVFTWQQPTGGGSPQRKSKHPSRPPPRAPSPVEPPRVPERHARLQGPRRRTPMPPPQPPAPSRQSSPDYRPQLLAAEPFPYDLTGAWVSQPWGEEAFDIAHDRESGELAGIALRCAPWSDCSEGDPVTGRAVYTEAGEAVIELAAGGRPLLHLVAQEEYGPGSAVLLVPAAEAAGRDGHWRVVQHAAAAVAELPSWTDAGPLGLAAPAAAPITEHYGDDHSHSGYQINIFA